MSEALEGVVVKKRQVPLVEQIKAAISNIASGRYGAILSRSQDVPYCGEGDYNLLFNHLFLYA